MRRPVFIVGCPRSGTTLLYSMLVAAGGFAQYRKETYFYDLLPRFPDLTNHRTRERFAAEFLSGYLGKVPGLEVRPLVFAALEQCRCSAEFLPRLMDLIAQAQGMSRWVEATPVHVLHLPLIKQVVPDALFVHAIRDGRDCALSNASRRWVTTLPWDRRRRLGVAALYWQWITRIGRSYTRANGDHCLEVRFEDLIARPAPTLASIGEFIDHNLDYARIQQNPVHALKVPNSSFREERHRPDFSPVGRWRTRASKDGLELCEALIGPWLREMGYDTDGARSRPANPHVRVMRVIYPRHFAAKHFLKTKTALGRVLTKTRVWTEQPRPGEDPVRPALVVPGARLVSDPPMVSR